MSLELYRTQDGSFTLYNTDLDEIYHSRRGAVQESVHVFIQNGLLQIDKPYVKLLEVGFGTGLNFWLTFLAFQNKIENIQISDTIKKIDYIGIEPYLPDYELLKSMEFGKLGIEKYDEKLKYLLSHLNQPVQLDKNLDITLKIEPKPLLACEYNDIDLVFYDVFGYRVAPDLWSNESLKKVYDFLLDGGIFVTYCSKSIVRKTLVEIGFKVKKMPGPVGKREMVLAIK